MGWTIFFIAIIVYIILKIWEKYRGKRYQQLLSEFEKNSKKIKNLEKEIDSTGDVSQCASDIDNLVLLCDKSIVISKKLLSILAWSNNGKKFTEIKYDFNQFCSNLEEIKYDLIKGKQWKMRDAIERGAHNTISDIQKKYRNSSEHQSGRFYAFCVSIENSREVFDEETNSFADNAIHEVECKTGFMSTNNTLTSNPLFNNDLSEVDCMDGHSFEYWCADLLKKNGYYNINVTKGSGDQGVDIIAEKEDIHYAIQCKCYASDLGNTPVQEVHAGASFYHCQVAVVMTNRYFTKSAKELANATGVLLWDRDKLLQFIKKAQSDNV